MFASWRADNRTVARVALAATQRFVVVREEERALPFFRIAGSTSLATKKGRSRYAVRYRTSPLRARAIPSPAADRGLPDSPRCSRIRVTRLIADCRERSRPFFQGGQFDGRASPPCSWIASERPVAFDAVQVVGTVKAFRRELVRRRRRRPIGHHTGISLSSRKVPWANLVLRPSDCHFEVAPTTTATSFSTALVFMFPLIRLPNRGQPHRRRSPHP